jgi:uncharacterized protein DUF6641
MEDTMAILKNLAFAAVPNGRRSLVVQRRERLAERLSDQLALVKDPSFTRTVRRWRQQDGQKVQVDHAVRIRPWWMTDNKGQTILTVRYGIRPIEFEKGKAGIVVGSPQKLSEVIEALISATRAGELDVMLEQSKPRNSSSKKLAA